MPPALVDLVHRLHGLQREAAAQLAPQVEALIAGHSQDAQTIERTLDRLLDFCGDADVLALYKKLCRHYWTIDPRATADYVGYYRGMWDPPTEYEEEVVPCESQTRAPKRKR